MPRETVVVSKKESHLIKGVKPIMACLGSFEDFEKSHDFSDILEEENLQNLQNVNWHTGRYESDNQDFLTAGPGTYLISAIDGLNKFSQQYGPCTGLIVTGVDKETGENISFVTHQIPSAILGPKRESFIENLKARLLKMEERCKLGTVDAVVVGGKYSADFNADFRENYLQSIKLISGEVEKLLHFEPIVYSPKTTEQINARGDDMYFDTRNRRLYLLRPKIEPHTGTGSFTQSGIEKEKEKWKKKK